jgi:hypothetical protein
MQILFMRTRWLVLVIVMISGGQAAEMRAEGQQLTYYVQLIRGTDHEHRQEASWKPIGPKLSSRLSPVFRWKHYWEVSRHHLPVEHGKAQRCRLSDVREVEIELVNPSEIEIKLYSNGRLAQKSRQLVRTHMGIMGGERTADESWFVVVRRDEPQ